ncbi:GNAT family N-acetyltransferase [uncultured Croceicoccus sp.]|uniref:GNAT family N-acetyltransferase n=1 Tax=uncultured Croceicoccus sp. TaxID=1295329 RepID=UPI002638DE44|nr:GNAT family N-acetyltransferase [uncultured Croceicoccus sp.]
MEPIVTERLLLRPARMEDYPAHRAMELAPDFGLGPTTEHESWHRFQRMAGNWALQGYGMFMAFDRQTQEFLGNVGLSDFRRGIECIDGYPEAAWVFTAAAHGHGFATEGAIAAHGWLDAHVSPRRTVCIISPDNARSLRVADKLGYRSFGEGIHLGDTVVLLERVATGG